MLRIIFVVALLLLPIANIYGRTIVFRMHNKGRKVGMVVSLLAPCSLFIVCMYNSAGAQKITFWENAPVIFLVCIGFYVISWLAADGKIRLFASRDSGRSREGPLFSKQRNKRT